MKKVKIEEVKEYEPPNHFGTKCLKVQGEDSGLTKFWQGLSTFAPDGGADWQYGEGTFGSNTEKVYLVIEGSITVENEAGEQFVLNQFDSIAMLPNEKRKMWNSGDCDAKVVVTISM
jgi:glyoxylate utilization-related uncharacterized protein